MSRTPGDEFRAWAAIGLMLMACLILVLAVRVLTMPVPAPARVEGPAPVRIVDDPALEVPVLPEDGP